jgi:carboxyl-terminal processing protease
VRPRTLWAVRRLAPVPRFVPLIALVVVVLLFGMWVAGRHSDWLPGPVRDALVGDSDTRVVQEAIDRVHDTYYREIPKSALADDAIAGVVSKLGDRFSNYFDPEQYKRFKDAQNSEFSGVGLQVSKHPKGLRVDAVYDGSPAKRAGLRPGDVIVAADGRDLGGMSQQESVDRVKGPPGSAVKLTWIHDGKRVTKDVSRSTVTVPVVASQLRSADGCKIGVVRLSQFSSGAHAEVYAALRKLQKRGAKVFVLDLRDNGGGLVSEAQLIASAFLKDGPIVTTRGRAVKEQTLRATGDPVVPKAPLAVLVNGDTASASEIVTGALQDRDRATVVGTETFGKGVFQEVLELSNGGALDITAGQYFTPKGRNLGGKGVATGKGIIPDVRAKDDPKTKPDEGLDKAMAVVGPKCPS